MMPGSIGPMEIVVVLIIALIVLGPKKLPDVGRSIGRGMREFKDAISGADPRTHDDDAEFPGLDSPRRP
ncbi:MAG TPA: twin-arginine translocase TatA/TatE family subunit [Capillimicrobium sp.]|nr:twin-arginine translocase TatA/TatE family subunit [Capillimicrobium sp.]